MTLLNVLMVIIKFFHIFISILRANFLHLLFKGTVSQFVPLCLVVLVLPLNVFSLNLSDSREMSS